MLASLEMILRRQGENAELAEILAREAEVAGDPDAAGGLPGGAGRGPPGGARGRGRRAGRVPRRHRSQPGPRARARGADRRCSIAPETREGALDVLEPLAQARGDFNELMRAVRTAPGAARRSRRARALAAQDRRGRRRSDRQPAAGAGGAGRAPCGKSRCRARRSTIWNGSRARPSCRRAGAAKIEAAIGDADPDAARELALRAARLYAEARRSRRRRSVCTRRCWRATRRTSTRCRRWKGCTARRATSSGWRRS